MTGFNFKIVIITQNDLTGIDLNDFNKEAQNVPNLKVDFKDNVSCKLFFDKHYSPPGITARTRAAQELFKKYVISFATVVFH